MELEIGWGRRAVLVVGLFALSVSQLPSCGGPENGPAAGSGGSGAAGPTAGSAGGPLGGALGTGGLATGGRGTGGTQGGTSGGGSGGVSGAGTGGTSGGAGDVSSGGAGRGGGGAGSGGQSTGGEPPAGGAGGYELGGAGGSTGGTTDTVVAITRSAQAQASSIDEDEVRALVTEAVTLAGGLGFIDEDDTVVLKPNLITTRIGQGTLAEQNLPATVNGVTTDYRVTKVVAELVRAENPARVVVLEGSSDDTEDAYAILGYTAQNFGSLVDAFIPLEGSSCANRSTDGLRQAAGRSGQQYWASQEFLDADVVITLPVLKTHAQAGVTGSVKNIGIGMVPVQQYPGSSGGCTRSFSNPNHNDRAAMQAWIADFYSIRPADFSVMDGLQAVQNGPLPAWAGGDYEQDLMNMRLILASRDPVALDVIQTEVMGCQPSAIDYLSSLASWGIGTADPAQITVLGVPVSSVVTEFAGPSWACGG